MQNNIYDLRKRHKWTLQRLSQLSGIPVNTVWRMERGYGVTLRNAFKIARAFGVTLYELWNVEAPVSATRGQQGATSVRKLRLERGWHFGQFAKISGVSKATLFDVEGGHTPTLENAVRIANALGVSIYDIWRPSRVTRKLRG